MELCFFAQTVEVGFDSVKLKPQEQESAKMDPHPGFFDFNDAAELMPEEDFDKAYIDPNRPKKQRLRDALARGELPSDGMIIATELSEDLPEKGEVRHVRPAVYQKKTMGHANSIK